MRPLQERYKEGRLGEGTHRIQNEKERAEQGMEEEIKMIKKRNERKKRRAFIYKRGVRDLPLLHAHTHTHTRSLKWVEEEEERVSFISAVHN